MPNHDGGHNTDNINVIICPLHSSTKFKVGIILAMFMCGLQAHAKESVSIRCLLTEVT